MTYDHHVITLGEIAEAVRIVGFEVQPGSIASDPNEPKAICSDHSARPQAVEGSEVLLPEYRTIHWTYDVEWTRSEIKWSSRWDSYLKMTNVEIHWFSILNSLVIALFLSNRQLSENWRAVLNPDA